MLAPGFEGLVMLDLSELPRQLVVRCISINNGTKRAEIFSCERGLSPCWWRTAGFWSHNFPPVDSKGSTIAPVPTTEGSPERIPSEHSEKEPNIRRNNRRNGKRQKFKQALIMLVSDSNDRNTLIPSSSTLIMLYFQCRDVQYDCLELKTRMWLTSASFLAELSVSSPRKKFIFII